MRALDYGLLSAVAVLLGVLAYAWRRVLQLRNGARKDASDIARLTAEGSAAERMHRAAVALTTAQAQIEQRLRAQIADDEVRARVAERRAQKTLDVLTAAQSLLQQGEARALGGPVAEDAGRVPVLPEPPKRDDAPATRRDLPPPQSEVRPVAIEDQIKGATERREHAVAAGTGGAGEGGT